MRSQVPLARLKDVQVGGTPEEQHAAELLRSLSLPEPLSAQQTARVRQSLEQRSSRATFGLPLGRRGLMMFACIATPLAFAVVMEAHQPWVALTLESLSRHRANPPPFLRAAEPPPARKADAPPERPAVAVAVAVLPPLRRSTRRLDSTQKIALLGPSPSREAPAATRATPDVPEPRGLAAETELLAGAMRELQRPDGAQAALGVVRAYQSRFPQGELAPESRLLEVEALLTLQRTSEALAILSRVAVTSGWTDLARGGEMRVIYGELLTQKARCPEALTEFNAALAADLPSDVAARALYGRASCEGSLGDLSRARGDLEEYLRRFPHGARAAAVRDALHL